MPMSVVYGGRFDNRPPPLPSPGVPGEGVRRRALAVEYFLGGEQNGGFKEPSWNIASLVGRD